MAKMKIVIESVSININIFHHYLESNFFFFFFLKKKKKLYMFININLLLYDCSI